jgi:hypothetical protein
MKVGKLGTSRTVEDHLGWLDEPMETPGYQVQQYQCNSNSTTVTVQQ